MTPAQKDMMLHALGGNLKKNGRNYYCVAMNGADDFEWKALVARGLAKEGETINNGRGRIYFVTPAGVEALKAERKA